jgi:ATP-dependent Clp protease ATP-binding subunit ClpC
MYERFTDRARKVMELANQEAQRFDQEYVATEHILLGLIKEGNGTAAHVLKELNIAEQKVGPEIGKIVRAGSKVADVGTMPKTPVARQVLEHAIEEARALKHNFVGTQHLLLGVLMVPEGVAAQVLMNLDFKLEEVRQKVTDSIGYGIDADG